MDAMHLIPRQVIQDRDQGLDYRVLWVSPDQSLAYWICLTTAGNTPSKLLCQEVIDKIQAGRYILLPDLFITFSMDEPGEVWKRHRDRAWELIRDAVRVEPDIYDRKRRAEILNEIEEKAGVKRTNLYDYLGRYWKGGMVPDALLPNYRNCGKTDPLANPSAERRGRKKVEGAEGKVLTPQDTQNFHAALQKYYYTKDRLTLEKTYKQMQRDFYAVRDEKGVFISLLSPDEIPSRAQFLYWHRKNKDILVENKVRDDVKNYNLKSRASIEKTETFLSGPCAAAQIDATIADIHLVRQDDRNAIIGRPTLYFLIDCFSRMVLGMHITLDAPSEQAALRCILNALEDKVEYCARYGMTIQPDEWVCRHVPSSIIADRGEVEGTSFDQIVKKLGISIENMPPYRGDLKGIIEQFFHLIDVSICGTPGKIGHDAGERCTHDYRLDAKLDIVEFTQIIIYCVLLYNNYHYMESYVKTPQMRQLQVMPVPKQIWEYGLRYCNGVQKVENVAQYRYVILPKGVASITDNGIQFKGLFYGCEQGFREKWFDCARVEGRTSVSVAYDPEDASHIYINPNASQSPIECFLLDGNKISEHLTIAEIEQIKKQDHEEREKYRTTEDNEAARTQEKIDEIIDDAVKRQPKSNMSKAQRIRDIAENRKAEAEFLRSRKGSVEENTAAGNVVTSSEEEDDPIRKILAEELKKVLKGDKNE